MSVTATNIQHLIKTYRAELRRLHGGQFSSRTRVKVLDGIDGVQTRVVIQQSGKKDIIWSLSYFKDVAIPWLQSINPINEQYRHRGRRRQSQGG